jgi:hypothetical protein
MYDHSGQTISLSPFGCRWDSGCCGYIFVFKDKILNDFERATEENWRDIADEIIQSEIDIYDSYIRGEVYGYCLEEGHTVEHKDLVTGAIWTSTEYEVVDSCCGFYGDCNLDILCAALGEEWEIIKEVKAAIKIPVIGNGDVTDYASAKAMKDYTGCDYLMVGRGAMGNPFVFSEINAGFNNQPIPVFTLEQRLAVLRRQVELMVEYKGERTAMLESRKHASWFIKGMRGAAAMRRMCGEISSMDDIERIIEKALEVSNSL